MKPKPLAIVALVALVASACSSSAATAGPKVVTLGVDLPLSGAETPNGQPTLDGVQLAVDENPVAGYTVKVVAKDDALNGKHDPQTGATNVGQLITDSSVFAVVGPFNSNVAQAEIPKSNDAGLIQCSPANTNPGLTKGAAGLALRGSHPDKIAYVRVATTDDIQGQAGADIAYNVAGAKTAYIVDDTETYGKGLADQFETTFTKLGGTVVGHDGVGASGQADYTALLTAAKAKNPAFVYFGGVTATGGGLLRKQMVQAGMGSIPFGGGDGISDGSAATASSFLNVAGADGDANTYMTVAAVHDIPDAAKFAASYKAKYGSEPGAYSASGYACAQIFLQALAAKGSDREAVRAYVTNTSSTFTTVLGNITFDANGDTSQHVISDYKFDPTTKDWKYFEQKDFTSGVTTTAAP
ncbi:MAG: branched-chain amino acid ABC transporter substrate-binding protein [Candidatus Limnocylindrales bacterium]|jgi:branched-chain amino acid transport system substrate-binding protein